MDNIAKALVLAIQYLGAVRANEDWTEEDDLKVVEEAASLVQNATEEEKATLRRVSGELGLDDWSKNIGIS